MKQTRKVLKVNKEKLLRHLKMIATHGIYNQGSEEAINIGKEVFYWQKGTEKLSLSNQEVGQLLSKLT